MANKAKVPNWQNHKYQIKCNRTNQPIRKKSERKKSK